MKASPMVLVILTSATLVTACGKANEQYSQGDANADKALQQANIEARQKLRLPPLHAESNNPRMTLQASNIQARQKLGLPY